MSEKFAIELLSPHILDQYPDLLAEITVLSLALGKEVGWSYWVDLIWILARLEEHALPKNTTILDAGGGEGLLQYLLAARGHKVISIDFTERHPNILHKIVFPIRVENDTTLARGHDYHRHVDNVRRSQTRLKSIAQKLAAARFDPFQFVKLFIQHRVGAAHPGEIVMLQSDLRDMQSVGPATVDAVVSCSVIEHMDPGQIPEAIAECRRVLKMGGPMIVTTSAARDGDWYHEPSQGWCFTKASLESFFGMDQSKEPWPGFDDCLEDYRNSDALKNRLASSYFTSGINGMPWGVWDPKYIPAGLAIV